MTYTSIDPIYRDRTGLPIHRDQSSFLSSVLRIALLEGRISASHILEVALRERSSYAYLKFVG